ALLVLPDRIELSTSPLPRECSTTELRQRAAGVCHRGGERSTAVARRNGRSAMACRGALPLPTILPTRARPARLESAERTVPIETTDICARISGLSEPLAVHSDRKSLQARSNGMDWRPISADSHITEPPNCYVDNIDPAWREKAPRVVHQDGMGDTYIV